MKYIKLVIVAMIILIFFLAVFQNVDVFSHNYKFGLDLTLYQTPVYHVKNYALLAFAFAFGVVLSLFLGIFSSCGKRSEIKNKNRRIKELENELSDIRKSKTSETNSNVVTSQSSSSSPFVVPRT